MKKILILTAVALLGTACSTTFKSGEISQDTLRFAVEKRQEVLETGKFKKPYFWNADGTQGFMYIVSTWKKEDGLYCRRMYERMYSGWKEAELYNEWCRIGDKKWAINAR